MPLDVGRQQRLATAALRDALAQRDQGCAFPSCDRSPRYCHAHRIKSWLDGGKTKLSNMCLLCEAHHVIVHRQGWHIRLDARGYPEFIPQSSSHHKPWTPPEHHSTTHSDNSVSHGNPVARLQARLQRSRFHTGNRQGPRPSGIQSSNGSTGPRTSVCSGQWSATIRMTWPSGWSMPRP